MNANMGLFDNAREANLNSTVAMVENALVELGYYLNECRVDRSDAYRAWSVEKGSASIHIAIQGTGDQTILRAVSPVVTLTETVDQPALLRYLLELNEGLSGLAFALRGDVVLLLGQRPTLDLDRSEVLHIIQLLRETADEIDDKLVADFGVALGGFLE